MMSLSLRQVLKFVPMHNYPLFVNVMITFVYVLIRCASCPVCMPIPLLTSLISFAVCVFHFPASFAYVLPTLKWNRAQIHDDALRVPHYKWALMGLLDSVAGIVQALGVNYLANGSLSTLLAQFTVPASMAISYVVLKTRYTPVQYLGAIIVFVGILVVLLPTLIHNKSDGHAKNPLVWAILLTLTSIPMCVSSVYKESTLASANINPLYMAAWVTTYQFLFSIPLLIPASISSNVPVHVRVLCYLRSITACCRLFTLTLSPLTNSTVQEMPNSLWNGMRCFGRVNSLPDDDCDRSTLYVILFVAFNIGFNIPISFILKYGGSNLLWLGLTVMVPLTNLSFALPFMPNRTTITWEDAVGLCVIMAGLLFYHFYDQLRKLVCGVEPTADVKPQTIEFTSPEPKAA